MYTIKQAAVRSGVPVATIRAWERRYGVIKPARTEAGYRLYDDGAIRQLDAMRRLVEGGMPPSLAALQITDLPAAEVAAAVTEPHSSEAEELAERFVSAAADLDDSALSAIVDDLFARGSFERVTTEILFPALRRLGEAWTSGRVSVAGEHLASHIVARRLGQMLDAAGASDGSRPLVMVGLAPGSRHELGALCFAVAARRAGLRVAYLGADLPIEDWVAASRSARAAVIGVPTARDRKAVADVAQRLAADVPNLIVAVGGTGATEVPGAVRLPDRLDEAVATLRRLISGPSP